MSNSLEERSSELINSNKKAEEISRFQSDLMDKIALERWSSGSRSPNKTDESFLHRNMSQ